MRYLLAALTRIPLPLLYSGSWFVYFLAFHVLRWRRAQVDRDLGPGEVAGRVAERGLRPLGRCRRRADQHEAQAWRQRCHAERQQGALREGRGRRSVRGLGAA